MDQIELRGSYAEMGRQQGVILRRAGFGLPPPDLKMLRFARQCEELIACHAPELLDELHGVADEAGVAYDALLTLTLTAPFDPEQVGACTVVAVLPERTANPSSPDGAGGGPTIVGRNYDFFHDVSEESATLYRIYPEGGHASLGACDIWIGRADGLNDAGLFVGIASIFMPWLQPGLAFWLITRLILDRCAGVAEGLDLIRSLPHAGSWTYLLADRWGQAAVVEPGPNSVEVRYPEDGLLVMTNHPVCPRWVDEPGFVPVDSHPRYDRLRALLGSDAAKGRVDAETVKAAMRDHEGLICSHGAHFPDHKFGTLWSVVGVPGERSLEIAVGHPCENPYRREAF